MKRLVLPAWACGLYLTVDWLRHMHTGGDAAFTAARGFAMALAAYLAVATLLTAALALCRVRVHLPLVPLLVVASLSTPLAAPAAFAATSTTTTSVPAPPVMHRLGPAPAPTTTTSLAPATTAPGPALTTTAPVAPPPNLSKIAEGGGHSGPTAPTAHLGEVSGASTWRVGHGDCFWSISRRVLAARLGRAPTSAEIVSYWRPLIEANRNRLARPSDPGLLFAGQELVLP